MFYGAQRVATPSKKSAISASPGRVAVQGVSVLRQPPGRTPARSPPASARRAAAAPVPERELPAPLQIDFVQASAAGAGPEEAAAEADRFASLSSWMQQLDEIACASPGADEPEICALEPGARCRPSPFIRPRAPVPPSPSASPLDLPPPARLPPSPLATPQRVAGRGLGEPVAKVLLETTTDEEEGEGVLFHPGEERPPKFSRAAAGRRPAHGPRGRPPVAIPAIRASR
eukprot:tig00000983_g5918.t1